MRAAPLPFCRCLAPTRTGALPSTKIDCKRSLTSQATPSLLHPCYVRSGGARGCCCQKCRFPGTPLHRACANLHLLHTRLSRSRTTPLKHLLLYPGQPLLPCANLSTSGLNTNSARHTGHASYRITTYPPPPHITASHSMLLYAPNLLRCLESTQISVRSPPAHPQWPPLDH